MMRWRHFFSASKPIWRPKAKEGSNYWKESIGLMTLMGVFGGSTATAIVLTEKSEKASLPKWQIEVEENEEMENISDSARFNFSFMNDSHFIHAKTNIKDRYEQFDVYRVKGQSITYGVVRFGSKLCGHAGLVHGGCIATIIDELCGWTFGIDQKGMGFTANLNVNYRIPIPANTTVLIRSEVIKAERRKVYIQCTIEDGDGKVYSDGVALFVKPKAKT